MRWLAVTAALLTASACLVAGIYFRDRDATDWRLPERTVAQTDADAVLTALVGGNCHASCGVELLGSPRPHHWVARIKARSETQCFEIDVETFGWARQRGLSGIEAVSCGASLARSLG
jgi:hypothetical protein